MNMDISSLTWDDIRGQVRKLRAQTQASFSNHNISTCKNFYFHPCEHKLFFLSNCASPHHSASRQFMLYYVNYSTLYSKEPDEPLTSTLPWVRVFDEYTTTQDEVNGICQERTRPLQTLSSFQMISDTLLMMFLGNVYAGVIGQVPKLVTSRYVSPKNTTPSFGNASLYDTNNRSDPKLGGIHHDVFAFIRNRDIWISTFDGEEAQLTFCSQQQNAFLSCGVAEYVIQEEFHRYTGYYWCTSPSSSKSNENVNRLLYLETNEENVELVTFCHHDHDHSADNMSPHDTLPHAAKYPRAGQPNATSQLYILEFTYKTTPFRLASLCHKRLWGPTSIDYLYPWAEYIVRLGWLSASESAWIQLLSRDQTKTVVIQIPYSLFKTKEEQARQEKAGCRRGKDNGIQELWSETQKNWVNISDAYCFLDQENERTGLIWSSEISGYRHLYFVSKYSTVSDTVIQQLTEGKWCVIDKPIHVDQRRKLIYFMAKKDTPLEAHLYVTTYDDGICSPQQRPIRRLTALGFSHIIEMNKSMDVFIDAASCLHQPHGIVIRRLQFNAQDDDGCEDPLPYVYNEYIHTHYKVGSCSTNSDNNDRKRLIPSRNITTLMPAMMDISDIDDSDGNSYLQDMIIAQPSPPSSIGNWSPTRQYANDDSILPVNQSQHANLARSSSLPVEPCTPSLGGTEKRMRAIPEGEIFDFITTDGIKLYGCLYKPRFYRSGKSYPTILHIYGGPKTQMVTNEFKFPRLLRYLMGVYFGFAVVVIDGRGSSDRGLDFEAYVKNRLGQVELQDQIQGLQYLATSCFGALPTKLGNDGAENKHLVSVIDLDRVAVTGWSYGGYLSLIALAQYPDIFKISIAGAPVTKWELYDSAYTERYMGMPFNSSINYDQSSVLRLASKFPNEENRLVIVHGLIDENVHFTNSEMLVTQLALFDKPYHLQVYPTEKHGLRHASVNEHFETLMFHYLLNYL